MGKRQKLGILSYPHIGNRITKDFACLKDLRAAYHCQLCQVFQMSSELPLANCIQVQRIVFGIIAFLSSLKELSLSYFVGKSRQSYWQIVELIKGIVLELFCVKSPESHLWQQRGYTFKEALTQTHIQNIVG